MNNDITSNVTEQKSSSLTPNNLTPSFISGNKRTSGSGQNLIGNNLNPQNSPNIAINKNENHIIPPNNQIPSNNNNINNIIQNQNQTPSLYEDFYTKLPIIMIIILSFILIILVIYYCSRKKWNKVSYYNDESENLDESSGVVYIR